jgi:hypothetical protein
LNLAKGCAHAGSGAIRAFGKLPKTFNLLFYLYFNHPDIASSAIARAAARGQPRDTHADRSVGQ